MTTLYQIWQYVYARDFAKGVHLLITHNSKAVTQNILSRLQQFVATGAAPGDYEIGKLSDALQKTIIEEKFPSEINLTTTDPLVPRVVTTTATPATTPAAKSLHKRHAHVHAEMVNAITDAARAEKANEIMTDIIPALDREYDALKDHHPDVEPSQEQVADNVAKLRKLTNVRTRISRLRGLILAEPDGPRLTKLREELAQKLTIRDELEAELNA